MLFGHQDDANKPNPPVGAPSLTGSQDSVSTDANPLAVDPATGVSLPVAPTEPAGPVDPNQDEPSVLDQRPVLSHSEPSFAADPAPTTPFGSDQAATPTQTDDNAAQTMPEGLTVMPTSSDHVAAITPQQSEPTQPSVSHIAGSHEPDNLLNIKQQALSQLSPLVNHLEQNPEEKFRTTMMLIQSTDNSALLKDAYEAAQAITDDKARAQALLDVVNEINYFTQQTSTNDTSQTM